MYNEEDLFKLYAIVRTDFKCCWIIPTGLLTRFICARSIFGRSGMLSLNEHISKRGADFTVYDDNLFWTDFNVKGKSCAIPEIEVGSKRVFFLAP